MPTATERSGPADGLDRLGRTRLRIMAPDAGGRVRVRSALTRSDPTAAVLRPMILETGERGARVALVPDGALLLGGDAVEIDVHVEAGLRLDLVETGGTVAFDMRGARASWKVRVRLDADARLGWAGLPFVVAQGACVERDTVVHAAAGSAVALRETLVLGRFGELPGRLHQRTRVQGPDGPVLVEDLDLDTGTAPLLLGHHRAVASVLLVGAVAGPGRGDDDRFDLDRGDATLWRRLGVHAHEAGLDAAWDAAVEAIR